MSKVSGNKQSLRQYGDLESNVNEIEEADRKNYSEVNKIHNMGVENALNDDFDKFIKSENKYLFNKAVTAAESKKGEKNERKSIFSSLNKAAENAEQPSMTVVNDVVADMIKEDGIYVNGVDLESNVNYLIQRELDKEAREPLKRFSIDSPLQQLPSSQSDSKIMTVAAKSEQPKLEKSKSFSNSTSTLSKNDQQSKLVSSLWKKRKSDFIKSVASNPALTINDITLLLEEMKVEALRDEEVVNFILNRQLTSSSTTSVPSVSGKKLKEEKSVRSKKSSARPRSTVASIIDRYESLASLNSKKNKAELAAHSSSTRSKLGKSENKNEDYNLIAIEDTFPLQPFEEPTRDNFIENSSDNKISVNNFREKTLSALQKPGKVESCVISHSSSSVAADSPLSSVSISITTQGSHNTEEDEENKLAIPPVVATPHSVNALTDVTSEVTTTATSDNGSSSFSSSTIMKSDEEQHAKTGCVKKRIKDLITYFEDETVANRKRYYSRQRNETIFFPRDFDFESIKSRFTQKVNNQNNEDDQDKNTKKRNRRRSKK